MKTFATGVALVIGGIWVKVHYTPDARLCNSAIGGFAQMISSGAHQDCSEVRTAVELAPWAIGIGAVIVVVSVLFFLGILGAIGVEARQKRKAGTGS